MAHAEGDSTPDSRASAPAPNHVGTVYLQYAGQAVPLRFSWAVIHQLQTDHGLDGWMDGVAAALDNLDMSAMAGLMGLVAGVDEARARELCVPVLPAKAALTNAWTVAMTGNVPAEDSDAEKLMPQMTLLGLLSKLRFGRASAGATSGTSPPTQPA